MKIITAIYDKKAKCIGRPIFQENIEKAISGVKDALNSMNTNGEYLMTQHREHPEDYKLIQLGYLNEESEITTFNAETGTYSIKPSNIPFIVSEQKDIIEFKDIELQDHQQKISAETVYKLVNEIKQNLQTEIYESIVKAMSDTNELIKESIKNNNKKGWSLWKK